MENTYNSDWIDDFDIPMAYLYLKKQISYENNVLLHLKKQIADFEYQYNLYETNNTNEDPVDFSKVILKIKDYLNNGFEDSVNFEKVVKKTKSTSLEENILDLFNSNNLDQNNLSDYKKLIENFIENKDSLAQSKNTIDYNHIIDCPIEIHILTIIWIKTIGIEFDRKLTKYTYAFRLDNDVISQNLYKPLFKSYSKQYQQYKNSGLNKYNQIINEEKEKAFIINLDLRKFYYSIDQNIIEKIKHEIIEKEKEKLKNNGELSNFIFTLIEFYSNKVKKDLNDSKFENKICLPIGLYSSPIIANYILKPLDDIVISISPASYSRYVDDMFIIFKESKEHMFKTKTEYLEKKIAPLLNKIKELNLKINEKKTVVEWGEINAKNSNIEALKKKLDEKTSAFSLLATEHDLSKLYNKIITSDEHLELKEEKYNISVYLTKLLYKFELVEDYNGTKELLSQVEEFLKFMNDQNIFKFIIYLEKIFTLLIMGISPKEDRSNKNKLIDYFYILLDNFYKKIDNLISYEKDKIYLDRFLKNSFTFALSLNPTIDFKKLKYISQKYNADFSKLKNDLFKIAQSNMFNRTFINYPLLNYLNFSEEDYYNINFLNNRYLKILKFNYTKEEANKDITESIKLNLKKIKLTPRFIHLNHINIYYIKMNICKHQFKNEIDFDNINILDESKRIFEIQFDLQKKVEDEKFSYLFERNLKHLKESSDYDFNFFKVNSDSDEKFDSLRVGVSSILIEDKDILEQLNDDYSFSLNKKEKIIFILNQAKINKVNFLVFSELSIPIELLKLLSEFSRINNIVITGGLEYVLCNFINYNDLIKKAAYNCLFTILPFNRKNWTRNTNYTTSFIKLRLKNDYAPGEITTLLGRRIAIPTVSNTSKIYDLFSWNGVFFTNFNCFELSDIKARSLFKNYIDILSASVYNKDLVYFKNIIDSTSRDLHTYVIQSNSGKFSDSSITSPSKKDRSLLGVIGGGLNPMLLVNIINIKKLREFQLYDLIEQEKRKNEFKFTPPGINPDIVKLRIQNNIESSFNKKNEKKD